MVITVHQNWRCGNPPVLDFLASAPSSTFLFWGTGLLWVLGWRTGVTCTQIYLGLFFEILEIKILENSTCRVPSSLLIRQWLFRRRMVMVCALIFQLKIHDLYMKFGGDKTGNTTRSQMFSCSWMLCKFIQYSSLSTEYLKRFLNQCYGKSTQLLRRDHAHSWANLY